MNREIKFRVWNGNNMEYDIVAGRFGVFYINAGENGDGLDLKDVASLSPFNTKYSDSMPLMQFTGFLDRSGREIFEGDIIEIYIETSNNNGTFHREVEWMDGGFCVNLNDALGAYAWCPYLGELNMGDIEVVGNIYEKKDE